MKSRLFVLSSCAMLAAASVGQAALLAYEPFNYSSIGTGTATTATGFTGTWTVGQGSVTVMSNLTYTDTNTENLATQDSAARINTPGRAKVSLGSSITLSSTPVYASALVRGGGNSGGDGQGFFFTGSGSGANTSLFAGFGAGFSATHSGFGIGGIDGSFGNWANPNSFSSGGNFSNGSQPGDPAHWIVLAITNTGVDAWIDPTVDNVEAGTLGSPQASLSIALGSISGIGLNTIAASPTVDEIRIGQSFLDVSGRPVPEPAILSVLAGLGMIALRRRA